MQHSSGAALVGPGSPGLTHAAPLLCVPQEDGQDSTGSLLETGKGQDSEWPFPFGGSQSFSLSRGEDSIRVFNM